MSASSDESRSPATGERSASATETLNDILQSGHDVRERVRQLVVGFFRGTSSTTTSAREAIQGLIQTATDIADRAAPDRAENALRNVIDGVTAGLQSVAQSTQFALQEAAGRGQKFASEDLDRVRRDLDGIGEILTDTVRYFTSRVSEETGTAMKDLKTHAERAVSSVTPSIRSTMETVTTHPIQTASEAAGAAMRGGQLAAGALLNAMSGLLAGAADLLDPARTPPSKNSTTDASAHGDHSE
ncbi:MAG: DUF6781 family protein [Planctomycetota bacterium]